ncbi:putative MFS-type transporter YfcJ [Paenibacillus allorhizoplanae]|uniref:MFS-type transporter YfcJ n=1 Tax=Paenibacillus allorhizoplanae TaxID=2905648 RepID=A0ABN8GWT5_9BACL|nr:MFS transporter [Paenibacillus allorhizoplanae]CAH1216223.1 putative MFS-type transporter YfcJ [Paenibacillus allorhizoplanae]
MTTRAISSYRIPLFCAVTMLFWMSMYTSVPIMAPYVEFLGGSHQLAGWIVGMYGISQMLLRIPVGIMSDRFHKRRLFITFGLLFTAITGLGLWFTHDFTWILILRALAGAAAATWVDFTVLFTSYYKHEESTKAIGTISFFNSLGQVLGILSAGWAADKLGWESVFILGAILGLLGMIGSFFLIEKVEKDAPKITMRGIGNVATDRTLLFVSLLAILSQVLIFATVFGFTPVYAMQLGADKFSLSLLSLFANVPVALASLFGGRRWAMKYGEKRMVVAGFLLMGIFTLTVPFTHHLWLLMITQAFAGFGRGLSFTLLMGMSIKHMPADKRATAMGFFQAIYGLGMFVGPVLMGIIGDYFSLNEGFIVLGVLGAGSALLAYLFVQSSAKKQPLGTNKPTIAQ